MIMEAYNLMAPSDKGTRDALRQVVRDYCARQTLIAPLSLTELDAHATRILESATIKPALKAFVTVLVGNEMWRHTVARTPFNRRILLLPQCLKSSTSCRAEFDTLGLLCAECGQCSIGTIQREAEKLGYVVLVAEGSTGVAALLARGEADAVIGVSCLQALEKSFRPLTAHAIPGIAVPLLRNECVDTVVDLDWVQEVLGMHEPGQPFVRLNLQTLRHEVNRWFEPDSLKARLCTTGSTTEMIATEWMLKGGKRWRPLLAAGVYRTLHPEGNPGSETFQMLAIAVECFHKASLIHDDIEDEDDTRYGEQTLHRQYGTAVALNVGDLLIGEGYRLIAESKAAPDQIREMMTVAALGHRTLCIGQGEELLLRQHPDQVSLPTVLEIFRRKTAPAFDVALQLGAIGANCDQATRAILAEFSNAIGIAYQIGDDLDDHMADRHASITKSFRPSVFAALARQPSVGESQPGDSEAAWENRRWVAAEKQTRELLQQYEEAALQTLQPLRQSALKCFLYRIVTLILHPTSTP